MVDFFQTNRGIVLFIYGQAFFVLGLAIALQSRKHSQLGWAQHLWLLATFGLIHGIYEWGSVFIPIQQTYLAENAINLLRIVQLSLEVISFLALLQFGIELIALGLRSERLRALPLLTLLAWIASVAVLYVVTIESFEELLNVGDAMARYLLAVPGASFAAWGLWQQAQQIEHLDMPRIENYLRGAAYSFAVYAVMSSIVPRGDFFPATIFNYDTFIATVGVPVAIFRGICGIIIAYLIIRGLEIFDVETDRLIEEAAEGHAIAADRERIGRELHDNIIQSLYTAGLTLEDAAMTIDKNVSYAKEQIAQVATTLNRTIRDIRAFILDLRHDLDGANWRQDLGEIVRAFRLQTLIDSEFAVVGVPEGEPSDNVVKEILAIAREALTNIARHAHATHVSVTLTYQPNQINLEIADNGVGFTSDNQSSFRGEHQGLANMRARAGLVDALLTIDSARQRGTRVQVLLPKNGLGNGKNSSAQDRAG